MTYDEIAKLKCTEINSLPENKIDEIIEVVIDYYYNRGFPYYPVDTEKIKKEYNYLLNFDIHSLELDNNHLQQNMNGLNTVNTFHPEMWSVRCKNSKTPMEIYQDRNLFKNALRKRIKYSDTKLVDFNIRKSLKAFGTQAVSNFRPTIAKWACEKFVSPLGGGNVLDPCAGYGGRLMGALCSPINSYTGIDPNKISIDGNLALGKHIRSVAKEEPPWYLFLNIPFEDYDPIPSKKFDFIFTSPPYFDIEKYSTDETQSYIRYKTYAKWVEKFLKVLIEKSNLLLRDNCYFALNVAGKLIEDTLCIGNNVFGKEPEVYYMRLSKMLGQSNKNDISHKTEPIFVWKKS